MVRAWRKPTYRRAGLWLLLAATVAGIYAQTARHDFIAYDDDVNIFANVEHGIAASEPDWRAIWSKPYAHLYVPITYSVWGLLSQVAHEPHTDTIGNVTPLDAGIFHRLNLGVHLLNALLAGLLFWLCTGRGGAAWAGAMLMAVHPVQVEAVAWATGLKDLLSGSFAILCLILAVLWAKGKRPQASFAGSLVCAAAAILSKPQAASLPVLVVAVLAAARVADWRRALRLALPTLGLGIAYFVAFPSLQEKPFHWHPSLGQKLLGALDATGFYITKLVWPFDLMLSYDRTPERLIFGERWRDGYFVAGFALLAALGWLFWRRRRYFWCAVAALGAVAPVLGLVYFSYQLNSTVADRYLYLAMVGPGLAVALWLAEPRSFRARMAAWVAVTALAPLLALRSHDQVRYWHDTLTLFEHTGEYHHNNYGINAVIGGIYLRQGRKDLYLETLRFQLAIRNRDPFTHAELVSGLVDQGRYDDAALHLAEMLARRSKVFERDPGDALGLGLRHLDDGVPLDGVSAHPEALTSYRQALTAMASEAPDDARELMQTAMRHDPDLTPCAVNHLEALIESARPMHASHFTRAPCRLRMAGRETLPVRAPATL